MNRNATVATVTVEQAARMLGIGRGLAYSLAKRGELPVIRLGHRLVVPKVQIERLLAGRAAADRGSPRADSPSTP